METNDTHETTSTSLEILEALDDLGTATVSQIAEKVDRPPSTVHGHLSTLYEHEYVVKQGDLYHLGLKFLLFARTAQNIEHAYMIADKYTAEVVEQTGMRSVFCVEEHGHGVYIR
jgi:DNA-binding IclR family transcriptional regulator